MKKLISLFLALAMLLSVASFAMAEAEVPEGYPALIKDANGNVVDLGGMQVVVTDYWSPADGARPEITDAAAEAQWEYRDWAMKTYNFTMIQKSDGDWGTNPQTLLDFINTQGEENRMMIMRPDSVSAAMNGGLLYDMGTLDCLDFTASKWNSATVNLMSNGESIYGASNGASEPREVVFFNKRLVEEAGIDPESIYDLQANNEWTFDKFEELVAKCTRDTDNDGVIDIYGLAGGNNDDMLRVSVSSNLGKFFDTQDGKYICTAQSDEVLTALNWAQNMIKNYGKPSPSEDAEWNWYYASFKNGDAAFHVGQAYEANPGSDLDGMVDDFGMVCFPTGPNNTPGNYQTDSSENITVMPGFYDADRAWKIAFAWNIWTDETPGYETSLDPEAWKSGLYNRFRDDRAVDETYAILRDPAHVTSIISRLFGADNDVMGQSFFWDIAGGTVTVQEAIETKMPAWQAYLDTINANAQ